MIWQRHWLLVNSIGSGEPPPLLEAHNEGGAEWFDDYYIVAPIENANGDLTFAIGETRYAQQNFNYLIIGSHTAILFDAGPGVRDIRPVVESLTDLPILFVPSHFHYDHIGNNISFAQVGVVDIPFLRARADGNQLPLTWQEHLGAAEGFATPSLTVTHWLKPNEVIDIGGRELQVLYTPGHTTDSVSLLDARNGHLFSGDFIYPGPLYAFLPNSSLRDYLDASDTVLAAVDENIRIFGAHRSQAPGTPELEKQDVTDLRHTLIGIKRGESKGTGSYPVAYQVNDRMVLLAEPTWLQDW